MKITSVDIYDVQATWRKGFNPVIVRINTDEGISGLGEVGVAVGGGHSAYAGIARDLAEMHLIGANPLNSERVWETMLRKTWLAQGGGMVVFAGVSGIDQALWDIKGKVFNQPLYRLLGGKSRDHIRAYASQIHFGWPPNYGQPAVSPEELGQAALRAVDEGFTALKVDPITYDEKGKRDGWDMTPRIPAARLDLIYRRVEAIRKAVGPDIEIVLETHANPEITGAIQIGLALECLDLMYYEEPVNSHSSDSMAKVARSVKIPLAAGEHIYTRWGYRPYFEKQVLGYIQPDLSIMGGISEGKKVADMAHAYDIWVQCHCCGSPVTLAAALHLETAIPNFIIHEYVGTTGSAENRGLASPDIMIEKGQFKVPEGPGLGIDLDEKAISRYPCLRVQ